MENVEKLLQGLQDHLEYDPITGVFKYKTTTGWHTKGAIAGFAKGTVAGRQPYLGISYKNKHYYLHRVAFLFHNKRWPNKLDHINGNSLDNRLENLREATISENGYNTKITVRNTSGVKGVFYDKSINRWVTCIAKEKVYYRKRFLSLEEATKYISLERQRLHGEFANHG